METISGTHTVSITLTPGTPNALVRGTIDAYGRLGTYAGQSFYGALFGPAGTDFSLQNKGFIESTATSVNDAGIVFGGAAAIKNTGTIQGANGVLIFGAGGVVKNADIIEGTIADGIALQGVGSVLNTGIVTGAVAGIVLSGGGYVQNAGNISGAAGIAVLGSTASYVYNTGRIIAGAGAGVTFAAAGSLSNTGSITAGGDGIVLGDGGIAYNYGFLSGGADGVLLTAGGKLINTASLSGAVAGIAAGAGYASIYNYAAGRITGTDGVSLGLAGYVYNSGSIAGTIGAVALAGGILINDGVLSGRSFGVATGTAPATITNAGTILASATKSAHAAAVSFGAEGILLNQTSGRIFGAVGVTASGAPISIVNDGYIGDSMSYAVMLGDGGVLINAGSIGFGRYINGYFGGVDANGLTTIDNTGMISGFSFDNAIVLRAGGVVVNAGAIDGGIVIYHGGTLKNSGLLEDSNLTMSGIALVTNTGTILTNATLADGGTVINDGFLEGASLGATGLVNNTGTIDDGGVTLSGAGTLENTGVIFGISGGFQSGGYGPAVDLKRGEFATNSGFIGGFGEGVSLATGGTLVNTGVISGRGSREGRYFGIGVAADAGSTVVNDGMIYGVNAGAKMGAGATLVNAGSIVLREPGSDPAVEFASSATNLLVDLPGAMFEGQVKLGGGGLELAAGPQAGTATLDAREISGFTALTIDAGAGWEFAGSTTFASTVSVLNQGTILEQAGQTLTISSAISGAGTIVLGTAGITLDGSVAATQKIDFSGSGQQLYLGNVAAFNATIYDFSPGETIELAGILKTKGNGVEFSHGVLTIDNAGSPVELTFGNAATFGTETFQEFKDSYGVGITLSGGAMAFLTPPASPHAAPSALSSASPPGAAAATRPSPATAPTIAAVSPWAPHWQQTLPVSLPALTLQS